MPKFHQPIFHFTWLIFDLFFTSASAQVQWRNVDSLYLPLPKSMHVFFTSDSLEGKPNRAFYVSVSLKDKTLTFSADTARNRRLLPSQYFERNDNALLVVNCTFFSPTGRNLNVVIREGKQLAHAVPSVFDKTDSLYHYVTRGAIGIHRRRTAGVAWTFADTVNNVVYSLPGPSTGSGKNYYPTLSVLEKSMDCTGCTGMTRWKVETAVGGGPVLLTNGNISITNNQERMFAGERVHEKHPRTAMGYTRDGRLIILVIEGRNPGIADGATLEQEATILKNIDCLGALNLDGGGSSCMLINGKMTITPSDKTGPRLVPAVFVIKKTR